MNVNLVLKKSIVLFLLLSFLLIILCGCNFFQRKLTAPTNVRIEDDVLKWNSVSGAKNYAIFIDDTEFAVVKNTYYEIPTTSLNAGQTYDIAVLTKGDGDFLIDSDLSNVIRYTIPFSDNDNPNIPPTEVDSVTNESISDLLFESGLGYGVNALTAKKAVGEVRLADFFDSELLSQSNLGSYNIGSSRAKATVEESIKDEVVAVNSKLVYGDSSIASLSGMFTAGYEEKFSLSSAVSAKNHVHQYYFIMNHYVEGKNYQLKNYQQPQAYSEKISNFAINDIIALRNNDMSPKEFFDIYGTHLTMAVSYGGMVEVYYAIFSQSNIDSISISQELEASLNAGLAYSESGAFSSTQFGAGLDLKYNVNKSGITSKLYIASIGNNPMNSLTFEGFSKSYPSWVSQVSDETNYRIVDVADNGLVPIWKYFPNEYADVAKMLQDYFEIESQRLGNTLINKVHPIQSSEQEKRITMQPANCRDNNQYNPKDPVDDQKQKAYVESTLFELVISGTRQINDTYSVVSNLGLGLVLLQDPNEIKAYDFGDRYNPYKATLSNDTYQGNVIGTNINSRIGYGAVYVCINYTNGSCTQGYATNICVRKDTGAYKSNGEYIDILSETNVRVEYKKEISSVNIVIVYEYLAWWRGEFWTINSTPTNWRAETTLYFE